MSDSPLNVLRAGPPPPKVSLLPDAVFFTRAVPIAADTPPAEVATQVELALESLSPFPVSQLYHGYYFPPGASAALVFAAYRRRFTAEQTELWAEADLVLPTFAALLGAPIAPGTTLLLTHPESLTALHAAPGGPAQIFTTPLPPASDDAAVNEAALAAEWHPDRTGANPSVAAALPADHGKRATAKTPVAPSDPAAPAPPPLIDAVLQRAVHLHRALVALRQI